MLLAVDVGNTNAVFAVHDGAAWRASWRCSVDGRRTADEYGPWLTQALALANLRPVDVTGAVIGSVVAPVTDTLRAVVRRYIGVTGLVLGDPGVAAGVPVRLSRPDELGADRLANAVGGHGTYGGPLIVVDFGTATTFDVIAADGGYEGGVIAPGVHDGVDGLAATAGLPRVRVREPARTLGTDTVSAMESGVFWGHVGLVDGILDRLMAGMTQAPPVVATGGLAPVLAGHSRHIQRVDAMLTLDGLRRIHRVNDPAAAP